jgi:uroporphyrinogen-III synthase
VLGELRAGVDGLTFTSPSTVRGFLKGGPQWRRCAESAIVATLGPATSAAAREEGLEVYEADEKTMVALVEALVRGLSMRADDARRRDSGESRT